MKKLVVLFLLGLFVFLVSTGVIIGTQSVTQTPLGDTRTIVGQPQSEILGTEHTSVVVESPQRLEIPKLGVRAAVEHVGLDADRNMDVPKNNANVAWYELGYKPGEAGNTVIAGHFDTTTGMPAVFYNLNELEAGDLLYIYDQDGDKLTYRVTEKHSYPLAQVPLQTIFGSAQDSRLNLITCEGAFNPNSRLYSHRLVIFSELVPS